MNHLLKAIAWRYIILGTVAVLAFTIFYWNNNYIGITGDNLKILPMNYRELPSIVKSLINSEALISTDEFRKIGKDDKVKKITASKNQFLVNLAFYKAEDTPENRSAELVYSFPEPKDLNNKLIFTRANIKGDLVGKGHQRSRIQIELTDINNKKMHGPRIPFPEDSPETYFGIRPTITAPVPLGSFHTGFDPTKVKKIAIRFIIARYDTIKFPVQGQLAIDPVQIINNAEEIVSFFGAPSRQRVTKDNLAFKYQVNKLKWKMEENKFFVGINYPWQNYGWDVGKNPYGKPENSGWSSREQKLKEDFEFLKQAGVNHVRIYIFFDLRTGLEYTNGVLTGFDTYVRPDIEAMIRVAGQTGVKINLVLFDFGIADGNSSGVGEHPELIFSSKDRSNFLINLMKPLLQDMDKWNEMYGSPVYALELMNEPENMIALMVPGYYGSLVSWFQDLTNIIHNETSFKVTLGSHSIVDMQRWWNELKIDIWQFHFYKYMLAEHDQWPQELRRENIPMPGVVFAGEFEPYNMSENIEAIKASSYNGIMFWSFNTNDGFMLRDTDEFKELADWIKNQKEAK